MKSHLLLFLLIFNSCFICDASFSQDSTNKIYSIKFTGYKTALSKQAKATLNEVAKAMKECPDTNLLVTTYCVNENSRTNQVYWDRANNVITYFVERLGLKADRFVFSYGAEGGDCDIVELTFTDQRITNDALPHPNLRKKADPE